MRYDVPNSYSVMYDIKKHHFLKAAKLLIIMKSFAIRIASPQFKITESE